MIAAPVLRKGRLIIGMHHLDSLAEPFGLHQLVADPPSHFLIALCSAKMVSLILLSSL